MEYTEDKLQKYITKIMTHCHSSSETEPWATTVASCLEPTRGPPHHDELSWFRHHANIKRGWHVRLPFQVQGRAPPLLHHPSSLGIMSSAGPAFYIWLDDSVLWWSDELCFSFRDRLHVGACAQLRYQGKFAQEARLGRAPASSTWWWMAHSSAYLNTVLLLLQKKGKTETTVSSSRIYLTENAFTSKMKNWKTSESDTDYRLTCAKGVVVWFMPHAWSYLIW